MHLRECYDSYSVVVQLTPPHAYPRRGYVGAHYLTSQICPFTLSKHVYIRDKINNELI